MMNRNTIFDDLEAVGYVVLDSILKSDVLPIMNGLGEVISSTRVNYSSSAKSMLASRGPMSLHTDSWRADIIAWYCVSEGESGGESILMDARNILSELSNEDKASLKQILLMDGALARQDVGGKSHPILSPNRIFFADWLVDKNMHENLNLAVDKLKFLISNSEKNVINLKAGQCLIINNRYILHGRNGFEDGTKVRNLMRFWIKSDFSFESLLV